MGAKKAARRARDMADRLDGIEIDATALRQRMEAALGNLVTRMTMVEERLGEIDNGDAVERAQEVIERMREIEARARRTLLDLVARKDGMADPSTALRAGHPTADQPQPKA